MRIAMVGCGRMGAGMTRRLLRAGHEVVACDPDPKAVTALVADGAIGSTGLADAVDRLEVPRVVWMMVPAALVDTVLEELAPLLASGDVAVDGGNSHYWDDPPRARALATRGVHYVDCGVSGGVWGLEEGYGLMAGGEREAVARLESILRALAPGTGAAARTPGREGEPAPEEEGWLHCGPSGAGHLVKMVHNGIEYGLMAAYAEGLSLLRNVNAGAREGGADAETAPLRAPDRYRYEIDVAKVAEAWRRGTVVRSWLLDLTAAALHADAELAHLAGSVADSGEGRWTALAAIDTGTPTPVLTTALYERFSSRGEGLFASRLLSAMREQFGGHVERTGGGEQAP